MPVSTDFQEVTESMRAVEVWLNAEARRLSRLEGEEVERRLLAGENDLQISRIRYIVPRWRERPLRRLRIEWHRRRRR